MCLPEPCLHLITPICSVFSLKPIFIWFKPECSFWSEWVCVSTANVMLDWLVSSRRRLSGAAAAGLWAGGLHVQVPGRLSERDSQVRTERRCNLLQVIRLLSRCHMCKDKWLHPYEMKQVDAMLSSWEPGSATSFFSPSSKSVYENYFWIFMFGIIIWKKSQLHLLLLKWQFVLLCPRELIFRFWKKDVVF